MAGHGGNLRELARRAGRPTEDIFDFSASINPLGAPECLRAVISRNVENLVHYPDPQATELVAAIGRAYELPPEQISVGNGTSEILHALASGMGVPPASSTAILPVSRMGVSPMHRAVIPVPCYSDYAAACELNGIAVQTLPLSEDQDFAVDWDTLAAALRGDELVFFGQPNNPTGTMFDVALFHQFAAAHAKTLFVVDEAFADFVEGYDTVAHATRPIDSKAHGMLSVDSAGNLGIAPNVIVLRSMTKFFAIPGLRLGFAVAVPELAESIRRRIPPWSVNTLAQAVGVAVLADQDYARRSRRYVDQQRQRLVESLGRWAGIKVYPSCANFLLVRLDRQSLDAHALSDALIRHGIAIRTFTPDQHLDRRFFRVAVRTEEENQKLIDAIAVVLGGLPVPRSSGPTAPRSHPGAPGAPRPCPAIMFQGTSSNAGKSILTAALCRILLQDGVRVAPFKSQNMSLNSFVTADGGEMGRAQVVQAQACRLEPDVRMNPILLKPNSDTGCQVIVRGQPVGNMRVMEYVRYKPAAFEAAKACYDSLAAEFDAVVIEGAGSPGEVNLKSHDIVNMAMARYARAPVLIVGDIDRGGVFASFVGTMEVLAQWERDLVAGWVVNRFRGDARLLDDALAYTLAHTGKAVVGVVPYLPALNIPQEDSVEFKSGALDGRAGGRPDAVEIAVIDLPHISNFTDLDAFAVEPDVRLRIVRPGDELGSPDAVIIPGSKNTLADLEYLKRSGLAGRIAQLAAGGKTVVVGICGGFQMLGRWIRDPHRIESSAGADAGLGLLAVDTVLAAEKTLARTTAKHRPSGLEVRGYEIHHGLTGGEAQAGLFTRADGEVLGVSGADGSVWGTYLHGVFDADAFRRWFIDDRRRRRGLAGLGVVSQYDIEATLDRLADVVRANLDMKMVYRLLKL